MSFLQRAAQILTSKPTINCGRHDPVTEATREIAFDEAMKTVKKKDTE